MRTRVTRATRDGPSVAFTETNPCHQLLPSVRLLAQSSISGWMCTRSPSLSPERVRDVVRCRETFQREILKSRHYILKFLARHGFVLAKARTGAPPPQVAPASHHRAATRRGVLEQLGRADASITELAEAFHMTLTGMRKHVGVLEQVGLVTTKKIGRVRTCQLGPRRLEEETAWLERYRQRWDERFDELDRVVEELTRKETSDERKKRK